MTFWDAITERLERSRVSLVRRLRADDPASTVEFSIAFIALGAKLAKADGRVTKDEVAAFREVFRIAPEDEPQAARVFNLCRQDVTGYEAYADRVARLVKGHEKADEVRNDLVDGLFHIAMADGVFDDEEAVFIENVSGLIGQAPSNFRAIRSRHIPEAWSPRSVLGVPEDADVDAARDARRRIARNAHPDTLKGRGVPEEMIRVAEARLKAANRALEEIENETSPDLSP